MKEKRRKGAVISQRTIPAKANELVIRKSDTLSSDESKNAPNSVTLLYFRATIPSSKSKALPTKAISAGIYQWLSTKTKKRRDGILPSRVSRFGFTRASGLINGSKMCSTDFFWLLNIR